MIPDDAVDLRWENSNTDVCTYSMYMYVSTYVLYCTVLYIHVCMYVQVISYSGTPSDVDPPQESPRPADGEVD